jgi:cell division septation protein DedD
VALAVALGVGGWFLYQEYWAPRPDAAVAGADPAPQPTSPPQRGQAMEVPIPISVAVEAHQDLTSARQRIADLRRAEPNIEFYLAPVAVSGGLYYRLLAGPVADREAGTALLQRLVDAGHKTAFDTWAVRPTEFAFLLGEYDTRPEAAERVEELAEAEIPAYVVPVRYDPGQPRYRVYGGAFETAVEAEVMREMLENADLEASLVPRTGEPIA